MKFKEQLKYFIRGAGQILQIFPEPKNFQDYDAKTGFEKDAQALADDWGKVGKYLENSIRKIKDEFSLE